MLTALRPFHEEEEEEIYCMLIISLITNQVVLGGKRERGELRSSSGRRK